MFWLKYYSGRAYVSNCRGLGFEFGGLNFFDFLCFFATTLKLKYQRFESRYLEDRSCKMKRYCEQMQMQRCKISSVLRAHNS